MIHRHGAVPETWLCAPVWSIERDYRFTQAVICHRSPATSRHQTWLKRAIDVRDAVWDAVWDGLCTVMDNIHAGIRHAMPSRNNRRKHREESWRRTFEARCRGRSFPGYLAFKPAKRREERAAYCLSCRTLSQREQYSVA